MPKSTTSNIRTATMIDYQSNQRYTAYFCAANHPHTCRGDAAACNRVAERDRREAAIRRGISSLPHFHQPQPGTVTDHTGAKCPAATTASYPLNAYCACGAYLSCASGDADWADADPYDVAPTPDRPLPILQGLMGDMLRGGR